jgi:hypothetical protein
MKSRSELKSRCSVGRRLVLGAADARARLVDCSYPKS